MDVITAALPPSRMNTAKVIIPNGSIHHLTSSKTTKE
jgi:hypothetical protein